MTGLPPAVERERVIAVVRGLTPDRAAAMADALGSGGLSVIEVTMESEGALASLERLAGLDVTLGAGTVTSVEEARDAVAAGAGFLVSPHIDVPVARWALDHDVAYLPGGFTPTEIASAIRWGAPAVKVFPASTGGPDHVRALLGPFPQVRLIPTGGISAADAAGYLAAGAVAVGLGSWLTGGDPGRVAARAALAAEACRSQVV